MAPRACFRLTPVPRLGCCYRPGLDRVHLLLIRRLGMSVQVGGSHRWSGTAATHFATLRPLCRGACWRAPLGPGPLSYEVGWADWMAGQRTPLPVRRLHGQSPHPPTAPKEVATPALPKVGPQAGWRQCPAARPARVSQRMDLDSTADSMAITEPSRISNHAARGRSTLSLLSRRVMCSNHAAPSRQRTGL